MSRTPLKPVFVGLGLCLCLVAGTVEAQRLMKERATKDLEVLLDSIGQIHRGDFTSATQILASHQFGAEWAYEDLLLRGSLSEMQHHYAEAVALYLPALKKDATNALLLVRVGVCYYHIGNPDQAARYLRLAWIHGEDAEAAYYLGKYFADRGLVLDAKQYLVRAATRDGAKGVWWSRSVSLLEELN